MTLELTIWFPTPSLNDWANARQRWRYVNARRQWLRLVNDAVLEMRAKLGRRSLLWPRPPRTHVWVSITRYATRTLDVDNLYGGTKPVLDALKTLELIDDDKPRCITLLANQQPMRGNAPSTEIVLSLEPPTTEVAHG